MPGLLGAYRQAYPGVALDLQIANTQTIQAQLLDGRLDLALTEGLAGARGLAAEVVTHDTMRVIVAPRHPWAARARVPLQELARADVVMRERGSGTRDVIEAELTRRGVTIEPVDGPGKYRSGQACGRRWTRGRGGLRPLRGARARGRPSGERGRRWSGHSARAASRPRARASGPAGRPRVRTNRAPTATVDRFRGGECQVGHRSLRGFFVFFDVTTRDAVATDTPMLWVVPTQGRSAGLLVALGLSVGGCYAGGADGGGADAGVADGGSADSAAATDGGRRWCGQRRRGGASRRLGRSRTTGGAGASSAVAQRAGQHTAAHRGSNPARGRHAAGQPSRRQRHPLR